MNTNKNIEEMVPQELARYFQNLKLRIGALEAALDTLTHWPEYTASENVGFNGQHYRKLIFKEVLKHNGFDAIVETGTWMGDTTGYMSEASNLPVYSCESEHRFFLIARKRLSKLSSITIAHMDSRIFLRKLAERLSDKRVFFYLDAHWYDDFPLKEELNIILEKWDRFVVMIDDFKVPHDDGYGFDSYGANKELSMACFGTFFKENGLRPFFPAPKSGGETGSRRGCVVITKEGALAQRINAIVHLTKTRVL